MFKRHPILWSIGAVLSALLTAIVLVIIFASAIILNLINDNGGGKLGRDFSIASLDIDWGWNATRIVAGKIRMANSEGADDADMVDIEKLDFKIVPYKLLYGKVELPSLELTKPKIILEKIDEDTKNWELPMFSKQNAVEETTMPDDRGEFPVIGRLVIKDGTLTYRDHVKNMDIDLDLNTAMGAGGTGEQSFEVKGSGNLQKEKFTLEANGGSLDLLRDTTKEFPLRLKIRMGGTGVDVDGTFTDPVKMEGINASLKFTGNNLADLFYLTGIPLPPTPPYSLKGQLTKKGEVWSYNDFSGRMGDSDLSGNLSYDLSGERGKLTGKLLSHKLDGDDLAGFIGAPPSTKPGETASAEQKAQKAKKEATGRLIPDVPLQTERLKAADADVTLTAEKLLVPSVPFDSLRARFLLNNGHLKIDPLSVDIANGRIEGSIDVDGSKKSPPMAVMLDLKNMSLKRFFGATQFADFSAGRIGGRIELKGHGLSLADVLATSNGRLAVIMTGGKISMLIIEATDLDLAQAAPLLADKDRSTEIRCAVADFVVQNGVLNSKAVVFDTNDSLLKGDLHINLKQETIDGMLDAKPKDASLLSIKSPITISGKLKSPGIGIEPVQTGARAAAATALGVLLTPLAAIIPFIELGDAPNANCRALLANVGK